MDGEAVGAAHPVQRYGADPSEDLDGVCPLTPLENWLRRADGASGYGEGFIEHYLLPIIYPSGLTPKVQLVLAAFLVLSNVAIYALVWRRRFRRAGS